MTYDSPDSPRDVSPLIWHWLPLAILGVFVLLIVTSYGSDFYHIAVRSELGLIEVGSALLALSVVVFAIDSLRFSHALKPAWFFRTWLYFFALGGLFLAGEEVSWGQHFFGWSSPEYFAVHNIQRETNLHNLSELSEQLPKTALHAAAILGGIAWPLLVRYGKLAPPPADGFLYWLMPTGVVLTSAALGIAIRVLERTLALFEVHKSGIPLNEFKELNELYLILFVVVYLVSLNLRIRWFAGQRATETSTPASRQSADNARNVLKKAPPYS